MPTRRVFGCGPRVDTLHAILPENHHTDDAALLVAITNFVHSFHRVLSERTLGTKLVTLFLSVTYANMTNDGKIGK